MPNCRHAAEAPAPPDTKTQFGSQAMPTLHGSDTAAVHAPFPECRRKQRTHIDALSSALAACGKRARHVIDQTDEPGDQGTADICTEISRGVDEYLCFVEAHVG